MLESWRERCDRSGRARQRDAAVRFVAPSAPDNAMQSPGALLQRVAAVRRAADAVASIFWCSLLSPASTLCTAGDAARRDWQPSSTLSAYTVCNPLFVRKPPLGAVGSPLPSTSCVSKKTLANQNLLQRLAVAWTSCLGAPRGGAARCDGGPAASPLASLMCKMPSRGSGLG